jgi:replicative DNA helicase
VSASVDRIDALADLIPPRWDQEVEEALAGSLLDRPGEVWPRCVGRILDEDFHDARIAKVWEVSARLCAAGVTLTLESVSSALREAGAYSAVGGARFLHELVAKAATGVWAEQWVEDLLRTASVRRVQRAALRTLYASAQGSYEDVVKEAAAIEKALTERATLEEAVSMRAGMEEFTDSLGEDAALETTGRTTGSKSLDKLLGGLGDGQMITIAARPGMGKAQPLDAAVLTPRGFVRMGDLRVGDRVIGSDGKPHRVTGVYPQGPRPVYRVVTNDGATTECCDEHLWFTQTRNERRRGSKGSVKSLATIRETLKTERGTRANHHIPVVKAVEFNDSGDRPVPPYLLGLLLGDGCLTTGCVLFCNPEPDLRARFAAHLPPSDITVEADELTLRVRRAQRTNERSETAQRLASIGLHGTDCYGKFIPQAYLLASVAERLELLRGLLDTDGYVVDSGQCVEYSTSSARLAEDVAFLARSLGGIVTDNPHVPSYTVGGARRESAAVSHRMCIRFPNKLVPVSSAKHRARWREDIDAVQGRYLDRVEPAGLKECQCIAVDVPDHLYVTDGFILTHNTSLALGMLVAAGQDLHARDEEGVCLFVSVEMPRKEINRKAVSQLAGVTESALKHPRSLSSEVMDRVTSSANALAQLPIYVHDKVEWLHDLRSLLYRMRLKHKRLRLVVIDYLQLMRAKLDRRDANREQEVAEVSRSIKSFAKEFACPFLALSQLNRGCETRPGKNKRPMLADLRESGSLEQDSDVVMFVYRDEIYNKDTEDKGIAEIIVAKQRSGPTDTVRLAFVKQYTRFADLAVELPMGGRTDETEADDAFPEVPPQDAGGIETEWESGS